MLVELSLLIRLRLDRAHLTRRGDEMLHTQTVIRVWMVRGPILLLEKQILDVERPEQKVIEWGDKNRSWELRTLTEMMGHAAGFQCCCSFSLKIP